MNATNSHINLSWIFSKISSFKIISVSLQINFCNVMLTQFHYFSMHLLLPASRAFLLIGHLHDDVILLLRPKPRWEYKMTSFYYFNQNLAGNTKFKYKRKNEKDYGRISKRMPLCKWPILFNMCQKKVLFVVEFSINL